MAITAEQVRELREKTGAGMLDCKKALAENGENFEQAVDWLRAKGLSAAAKKSGRIAAEGTVSSYLDANSKVGVLVEVNSETDFVARNDMFQKLSKDLASHVAAKNPSDDAALMAQPFEGATVQQAITNAVAKIGENIVLRRFARFETEAKGLVHAYIHGEGRIGVLIELTADKDGLEKTSQFQTLAKDLALQVAAMSPLCVTQQELPADLVAREKDVLKAKALEQGKKAEMLDKIIEGQIRKWASEKCLIDQTFVKNPDLSVAKLLAETGKQIGGTVTVKRFARFELGEGIEKRKENFAEEVAAQTKK